MRFRWGLFPLAWLYVMSSTLITGERRFLGTSRRTGVMSRGPIQGRFRADSGLLIDSSWFSHDVEYSRYREFGTFAWHIELFLDESGVPRAITTLYGGLRVLAPVGPSASCCSTSLALIGFLWTLGAEAIHINHEILAHDLGPAFALKSSKLEWHTKLHTQIAYQIVYQIAYQIAHQLAYQIAYQLAYQCISTLTVDFHELWNPSYILTPNKPFPDDASYVDSRCGTGKSFYRQCKCGQSIAGSSTPSTSRRSCQLRSAAASLSLVFGFNAKWISWCGKSNHISFTRSSIGTQK